MYYYRNRAYADYTLVRWAYILDHLPTVQESYHIRDNLFLFYVSLGIDFVQPIILRVWKARRHFVDYPLPEKLLEAVPEHKRIEAFGLLSQANIEVETEHDTCPITGSVYFIGFSDVYSRLKAIPEQHFKVKGKVSRPDFRVRNNFYETIRKWKAAEQNRCNRYGDDGVEP